MLKVCLECLNYELTWFALLFDCDTFVASLSQDECQKVSTEGHNMRMELSDKFNNAIKVNSSSPDYNARPI